MRVVAQGAGIKVPGLAHAAAWRPIAQETENKAEQRCVTVNILQFQAGRCQHAAFRAHLRSAAWR